MKKIFVAGFALLLSAGSFSQPPTDNTQPPQDHPKPPAPEERWQHDSKRIGETLSLSHDQLAKLKPVFLDFYKDMDAMREKMPPPPPPPPPPLSKEDMEKILNKRNEQLKTILTPEQLNKLTEAEKQFHPHKPMEGPPPASKTPPPTK
jgi:Spy/CpxP family protein refolding chaperone